MEGQKSIDTGVFRHPQLGNLILKVRVEEVVGIGFSRSRVFSADFEKSGNPLLLQLKRELEEYFAGKRYSFTVPWRLEGHWGVFSRRVLAAVAQLGWGEVITYGALARRVGSPGAARAVGQVLHRNPLPLLIPCHRVVAAGGALGGFGGGVEVKEFLLRLEGVLL
jgi:methylated-DNA-[protein]-cysteine S-methyltransferase